VATFKETLKELRTWVVLVASTIASVAATQGGAAVFLPDVARDAAKSEVAEGAGAAFKTVVHRVNSLQTSQELLRDQLFSCRENMGLASERIRSLRIDVEVLKLTSRRPTSRVIERRAVEEAQDEPMIFVEDFAADDVPDLEPLPDSYQQLQQQEAFEPVE
jgi:hypothetical protein